MRFLEVMGSDLNRHPPGDLAHRRQQRQGPIGELHGLVSYRLHALGYQRARQWFISGKMKIGKEQLIGPEKSYSEGIGSLTLTIISARPKTSAAESASSAPAAAYVVSENHFLRPPPVRQAHGDHGCGIRGRRPAS